MAVEVERGGNSRFGRMAWVEAREMLREEGMQCRAAQVVDSDMGVVRWL